MNAPATFGTRIGNLRYALALLLAATAFAASDDGYGPAISTSRLGHAVSRLGMVVSL